MYNAVHTTCLSLLIDTQARLVYQHYMSALLEERKVKERQGEDGDEKKRRKDDEGKKGRQKWKIVEERERETRQNSMRGELSVIIIL
jgi:hypothetical protein